MRYDPRLILTSRAGATSGAASRALRRGDLVKLKRGAYVSTGDWGAASDVDRHRLRAAAYAESHSALVFSHHTAAAIHGIPVVGGRSPLVHATSTAGHSESGLRVHHRALGDDDVADVGGLLVTSIARTLADLAAEQRYRFALVPVDHCLRASTVTRAELASRAERAAGTRGGRRVARAFASADARSESPGESVSRGAIDELGFPAPRLQVPFGQHRVDFDWPEFGLIGEFDGRVKYGADSDGAAFAEAVWREKQREDQLRRRTGRRFARWLWPDAHGAVGLKVVLLESGLPVVRRSVVEL